MSRLFRHVLLKLADLFSRPLILVFLLVLPILLGLSAGEANVNNRRTAMSLAVVDEDRSSASAGLVSSLQTQGWPVRVVEPEEAERLLLQQRVDGTLAIPAGFGANLATLRQPPLRYTPAAGSLAAAVVQEAVAAALMPAYSQRAMTDALAEIHRMAGRTVPAGLEARVAAQIGANQSAGPMLAIDYVGSLRIEPTLTPVVSDHSLEVFFLSIYAVLGSFALSSRAVQRRLAAIHHGLALDFLTALASLLLVGGLQIALYSSAMQLRMGGIPAVRPDDVVTLAVCLVLMLGLGQLLVLLDERVRLFLGLMTVLLLAIAGGCFFPLSAAFVTHVSRYTPAGWALNRLLGVPVAPVPLVLAIAAGLTLIGYGITSRRVHRPDSA